MSHRKWRETKQYPSRATSGHQISCSLVSLYFLCDILSSHSGVKGSRRGLLVDGRTLWRFCKSSRNLTSAHPRKLVVGAFRRQTPFLPLSFVAADATASLACSGMICATEDSNRESRDSNASDALIDVGDDGEDDEEKHEGEESRCHMQMSGKMCIKSFQVFRLKLRIYCTCT